SGEGRLRGRAVEQLAPRRARGASFADRTSRTYAWLPDRRSGRHPLLSARPRAGARHVTVVGAIELDIGARARPRRHRADPRLSVLGFRIRVPPRLGALEPERRPRLRKAIRTQSALHVPPRPWSRRRTAAIARASSDGRCR